MNVFVHVQAKPGATAAEVEQVWGSTPEPVAHGPKGMFVLMVDIFSAAGEADQALTPHRPAIIDAVKEAFGVNELAELGPWELELLADGAVVNVTLRKQGLVLTTKDGIVAAAAWAPTRTEESLADTVQLAAQTLANARALNKPTRA